MAGKALSSRWGRLAAGNKDGFILGTLIDFNCLYLKAVYVYSLVQKMRENIDSDDFGIQSMWFWLWCPDWDCDVLIYVFAIWEETVSETMQHKIYCTLLTNSSTIAGTKWIVATLFYPWLWRGFTGPTFVACEYLRISRFSITESDCRIINNLTNAFSWYLECP